MSDVRQHLKQKVVHETREYLIIALYLFVVFTLLIIHKSTPGWETPDSAKSARERRRNDRTVHYEYG